MKSPTASPEPSICFEQSPAMVVFRQSAGNANRLLNTILVGLETLKSNDPIKPDNLVVAWSKPESKSEWLDTRNFSLRGAMVSMVDALDQYLHALIQIPGLVATQLHDKLNGRKAPNEDRRPTLSDRVDGLCEHYAGYVHPAYPLSINLLAAWRNKFVHHKSKEGLSDTARKELPRYVEFFRSKHGNADIISALKHYTEGKALR